LDKYEFSEPRVALTNTSSIAIAEWLPDNNRLLVTNSYPYTYHERIETVDIRTGEIQLYAERDHHFGKPVWLPAIRGVAYYGIVDNVRLVLSVSRGQPSDTETLAVVEGYASGLGAELPVEPGGRYLMYLVDRVGGRPQVWDSVGRATQAAAFAVAEWRDFPYPEYIQRARPRWSPNGAQLAVAVYPFLFLVEPGPQRVCEVSLGSVAGVPRSTVNSSWSPNGRYLAMITTATLPGELVRSTSLGVLDVLTGEQRQIVLPSNLGNIADISWGPNSRHLLALIQAARQQERSDHKLFLVDAVTGDVRAMLPKRAFGGGSNWGEQMTWSPNGQTIALKCPVRFEPEREIKEDRVCLIAAKSQP
jgi:Tol biopolymer transport system component